MPLVICMKQETKQQISNSIKDFRMPRYSEIPNVGLYLEQVTKYICEHLDPLQKNAITGSMISNYVKKGLVANPVKKQYDREQIAYLFFIAVAKTVLSLDALTGFIELQKRTYPLDVAYDFFCRQFEGLLAFTCEVTDAMEISDPEHPGDSESLGARRLLYSCIVAVTQKIYLEKSLETIAQEARE